MKNIDLPGTEPRLSGVFQAVASSLWQTAGSSRCLSSKWHGNRVVKNIDLEEELTFSKTCALLASGSDRQYVKLLSGYGSYTSDPSSLIYGDCKLEAPPPRGSVQRKFLSKKASIGR